MNKITTEDWTQMEEKCRALIDKQLREGMLPWKIKFALDLYEAGDRHAALFQKIKEFE